MKRALYPDNDLERIQNLLSYNILDSSPEPEYDSLLRLASSISNCPMAGISFIDQNRQWFKSKIGIPVTETPRDISICGHAIHSTEFFQISDLLSDDRFWDNSLIIRDFKLRSYGGAPLLSKEGYVLGVLCVMNNRPFVLTPEQVINLKIIAQQVIVHLNLRKNLESLSRLGQMAALGKMSSVTSHEINNAAFILGTKLDLLNMSLKKDSRIYMNVVEEVEALSSVAHKLNAIIAGIKNYSSRNNRVETISVNKLIEDTLILCHGKILYSNTMLTIKVDHPDCSLLCSPTAISQILLNLIQNSLDAIETIPDKWIEISVKEINENELEFWVTDSGTGIPSQIRQKIMQSFFTTKERGKGTGLGLNISRSIARAHGGDLYYDQNSPYTRFVLKLPRS